MSSGAEALFAAALAAQPTSPLVTFYDDASGERIELSARSLANWVAKTHFLLIDELGLGVGDSAVVALPLDWITVPVLLGCWSAGLCVLSEPDSSSAVAFGTPETLTSAEAGSAAADVFAINPASMTRGFLGAATPPAGAADYVAAVRPQPDTWASVHPPAGPGDPALAGLSRSALVTAANETAADLGLPPGARVMTERPWTVAADWITSLLAALTVGGSVVLVANADPSKRERRIEQEQVTTVL